MSGDRDLKMWVSDKLHSLMGYSQSAVVQFVISLSKKASSPADIRNQLIGFGCPSSADTDIFAEEIFSKVPHKVAGLSNYQKEEREAALLVKKQKTYEILDADDEDDDNVGTMQDAGRLSSASVDSHSKKGDSRKRHFRRKNEDQDNEEEEGISQEDAKRQVRRRMSDKDSSDEDIESEEARMRDQEERAQLERNMRARDAAGTKKDLLG